MATQGVGAPNHHNLALWGGVGVGFGTIAAVTRVTERGASWGARPSGVEMLRRLPAALGDVAVGTLLVAGIAQGFNVKNQVKTDERVAHWATVGAVAGACVLGVVGMVAGARSVPPSRGDIFGFVDGLFELATPALAFAGSAVAGGLAGFTVGGTLAEVTG